MKMTNEAYEKAKAEVDAMTPTKDGVNFQLRRLALSFETDFQKNPGLEPKAQRKMELEQIGAAMVMAKGGLLSCTDDEAEKLMLFSELALAEVALNIGKVPTED